MTITPLDSNNCNEALAIFFLYKTHTLHHKKDEEEQILTEIELLKMQEDGLTIKETCDITVITSLFTISRIYGNLILGFINEKRKKLKKQNKEIKRLDLEIQNMRDNLYNSIMKLQEDEIETGHIYVQVLDALNELSITLSSIASPIYNHVNNHRPPLYDSQKNDLSEFNELASGFFTTALSMIKNQKDYKMDTFLKQKRSLMKRIKILNKNQIKMIRREEVGTKISILYLNTLSESKSLFQFAAELVKAHRDFQRYSK